MNPRFLLAAAVVALLSGGALADPGHAGHDHPTETTYGRPGDPARAGRVVQVAMKESASGMAFVPTHIEVTRGEQIQFVLRNQGELDHELVIGTLEENQKHAASMAEHPDMAHEDPNAKRLKPKTSGVIALADRMFVADAEVARPHYATSEGYAGSASVEPHAQGTSHAAG